MSDKLNTAHLRMNRKSAYKNEFHPSEKLHNVGRLLKVDLYLWTFYRFYNLCGPCMSRAHK